MVELKPAVPLLLDAPALEIPVLVRPLNALELIPDPLHVRAELEPVVLN